MVVNNILKRSLLCGVSWAVYLHSLLIFQSLLSLLLWNLLFLTSFSISKILSGLSGCFQRLNLLHINSTMPLFVSKNHQTLIFFFDQPPLFNFFISIIVEFFSDLIVNIFRNMCPFFFFRVWFTFLYHIFLLIFSCC